MFVILICQVLMWDLVQAHYLLEKMTVYIIYSLSTVTAACFDRFLIPPRTVAGRKQSLKSNLL